MRQAQAMSILMSAESVFLTGAPGAGKSHVLNEFVAAAARAGMNVAVTASTGIAATHIGGVTIHSWSGIGVRESLSNKDLDAIASKERTVRRFTSNDVLVIDEISMLSGAFLDMLDRLARVIRGTDGPFGGLQVVLVGDMFQLPPINRSTKEVDFAFNSAAWRDLDPTPCYLTEQHRQVGDALQDVLDAMRSETLSKVHRDTLDARTRISPPPGFDATRLYSHNVDVDAINAKRLVSLPGEAKTFTMKTKGNRASVEQFSRGMLAPPELELKVGAEVMFVANDPGSGYANGTLGKVVSLDSEWPVVETSHSKRRITVEPHLWQMEEDGQIQAEIRQLPLRLAWAITIHKSQGMSLDAAEIDLSRSFTPGMGYVALSRLRTIDGLYLRGLNQVALKLDSRIYELDLDLRRTSARLALTTPDWKEPINTATTAQEFGAETVDSKLLEALKQWRRDRARVDGVPAYVVAHDVMLEEIAQRQPKDEAGLRRIKGMGISRLGKYGAEILGIVAREPEVKASQESLW